MPWTYTTYLCNLVRPPPPRLPHQTRTRCPQELLEQAITWSREPNLIFRHLYTYFSVLSAYFRNQPTIPLGFFWYLDHLQYLSGMHEWTRVHEYHINFFDNRVLEMRFRNGLIPMFCLWGNMGLMKTKLCRSQTSIPPTGYFLMAKFGGWWMIRLVLR